MAHISPFVADIDPLIQSLRQFTPRAREDRRLQLAGLEQQQDIRGQQLEQLQRQNKSQQIQFMAEQSRSNLLGDISDIDFVLKNGAEGLTNRLRLLSQEKGEDSEDMAEIVGFFNQSSIDPVGTFQQLTLNRERAQGQLNEVNQILTRSAPTKFQKTASFLVRNDDGSTGIVTGVFDPSTGGLTTETTAFRADQLVSRLGETPEEITTRKAEEAERVAKGKETGKLEVQAKLLPAIRSKIKEAEKQATAKGESFTDLNRAKAALPGLREVTEKLKLLADVATVTLTARGFDVLVKELGFGATKGATARTTMRAIVDNQVLPLLRETFGAAFTKEEGDSLRATLLDQNTAPEQMKATLDAFIEQKVRNIETKEAELSIEKTQTGAFTPINAGDTPEGTIAQSPDGTQIQVIDGQWVLK